MAEIVEHVRHGRFEDFGIGGAGLHFGGGIEQSIVGLLMHVAHFGRGFDIAAHPSAGQVSPIPVVARPDVNDD